MSIRIANSRRTGGSHSRQTVGSQTVGSQTVGSQTVGSPAIRPDPRFGKRGYHTFGECFLRITRSMILNRNMLYQAAVAVLLIPAPNAVLAVDFEYQRDVKPFLTKYCVGCHNEKDNESEVQLQSLANIFKGGPKGAIVVASNASESSLIKVMLGTKEPKMPPDDSPQPTSAEIAVLQKWIEQGAKGSDASLPLKARFGVNAIPTTYKGLMPITALGRTGNEQLLVGRFNSVYFKQDQWSEPLPFDIVGKVTQIRTTYDGQFTVIASGIPGVGGQASILKNKNGAARPTLVRVVEGHQDTLCTAVLSPDAKILATGGYDRKIQLWSMDDGKLVRTLTGHNGAIYDLDFDATSQILASASADETIKIWRVDSGERLDTFGQCEAEQFAVRFDSPRNRVLAAGADRRVRVWKLLSLDKPSVSPMLYSTFAHEGSVTQLALSKNGRFLATASEDKTVKLWGAQDMSPLGQVGTVDEVPSGLLWDANPTTLTVSSLGGQIASLNAAACMLKEPSSATPKLAAVTDADRREPIAATLKIDEATGRHSIATSQKISGPCEINAVLTRDDMSGESPGDWYSFNAKTGEPWVVEIDASRSGSPMDSVIDILEQNGEPIVRTRLQATRETYFTFRGKDSTISDDFRLHRWEDMELNELLYAGGEVVKLWLYPRGPDSGFKVYPGVGSRFTYFDTTATTHALNEPAWIVRELANDEPAVPNGLPVFPIYYTNDDEASRQLGKDSQITFTAKTDGQYLIRVRDTRGQSGDNYKYKLTLRSPMPRYKLRAEQKEITLRPGVGTEFDVAVNRFEGCDDQVDITLEGVPEGILVTQPLTIQAGQSRATAALHLPASLATPTKEFTVQISSQCKLRDRTITDGEAVKLLVKISDKAAMPLKVVAKNQDPDAPAISELEIRAGQTVSANLVIERGENKGDISFGGDDSGRNLPHGCYVDNIGLSGLLIPAGQSVREVFITAAPWVATQTRLFHLRAKVDGNPTTLPIRIRVVGE